MLLISSSLSIGAAFEVNAIGGLGGALASGSAEGVAIGATAGGNAAEHNYLNHSRTSMLRLSEVEQYERAARECAGGDASACGRRDALAELSRTRDRELQSACAGATPALCNSKIAEARSMGNAVHGSDGSANGQFVWANSPKPGFALNVATAGEVQPSAALRQNFHVQLAQSTSQGVFLLLPGPEDVVVGALLLIAPGKVLAEVVLEGGHKLLRFADGTTARVGSEEARLLARARIAHNNHYADGSIADPLRPMSLAGPWVPAAERSPRQADELIALSLPAGSRVNGMRSADAANAAAKSDGYEAPFLSGTSIVAIARFVRVFGGDSRQNGTWIMRVEDVAGLTPEQIASKYALPQVPTRITDVQLPPGTKLEVSMAGAISPGASRGVFTGDNGGGGGVQFQIKATREEMSPSWFVNERPLK